MSLSGRGIKLFFCVATENVRRFLDCIGTQTRQWGVRRDVPGEGSACPSGGRADRVRVDPRSRRENRRPAALWSDRDELPASLPLSSARLSLARGEGRPDRGSRREDGCARTRGAPAAAGAASATGERVKAPGLAPIGCTGSEVLQRPSCLTAIAGPPCPVRVGNPSLAVAWRKRTLRDFALVTMGRGAMEFSGSINYRRAVKTTAPHS